MAKYLTKYENMSAYEADTQKDYPNVSYIAATDEVVWLKEKPYEERYLTFVALEDGTFKFTKESTSNNDTIYYSTDNGATWTALASNVNTPTVAAGSKIMWKAEFDGGTRGNGGIGIFSSTGQFDIEGNIMSILYGEDFKDKKSFSGKNYNKYIFADLFSQEKPVSAENLILPATTLTEYCYYEMFRNCTSLRTAPTLPDATLANSCYSSMFAGCTSLTTATILNEGDYVSFGGFNYMFNGCTSLSNITCLIKGAGYNGYNYTFSNWVSNVASSGTFTKNSSNTTWPTGVNGIPDGWTVEDFQ